VSIDFLFGVEWMWFEAIYCDVAAPVMEVD
jgi:hypothetical protein